MTSHVFVTSFVLHFEPGEQRDADARARASDRHDDECR